MDRERQLHDAALAAMQQHPTAMAEAENAGPDEDSAAPRPALLARLRTALADDPRLGFGAIVIAGAAGALALALGTGPMLAASVAAAVLLQAGVALAAGMRLFRRGEARLAAQRDQTERMVFRDALTGALNRRGMMRLIEGLMGTGPGPAEGPGSRTAASVTALHIDLDHFKSVNDTLGHEAGDHVLEVASARMDEAVGEVGAVCRVGGDEFCAVLWEDAATEGEATRIAGDIVETARVPIDTPAGKAQIGASIGIAFWEKGTRPVPGRLLADADLATYVAKSEGRGRFALFDARLREAAEAEARVARALSRALSGEKASAALQVWLQPVVDAADGRVLAAEALLRWFDPELGEIPPETALPAAERNNLLDAVEELVFERTLTAVAGLEARGLAPGRITMNLDGVGLRRHGLADRLAGAAERHGVTPGRLGVEVSEAACGGRGGDLAMGTLADLRGAGVGVVIDRLGRDQVSLSALSAIRAGEAKLDRGLVGQIGQDGDGRSLLQGLVTLSRSLDLRITASGVETREQLAVLRELGVDAMQGFAIARPMAPDAFAEWLDFGHDLARTG